MIRFGLTVGQLRSRCWQVGAGMTLPELFFERENLGKAMHVSLHQSGRWHLKVRRREIAAWPKPNEISPGFIRAVTIVQFPALADHEDEPPAGAALVPTTADADATHFNVFYEAPGANLASWPGRTAMGTVLVGRIALAGNAGTCCVVAHREPFRGGAARYGRPSDSDLQRIRAIVAKRGRFGTTTFGMTPDGAIALIDGISDKIVLPAQAEA